MEITLIKRDKTRSDLKKDLGISPSTLAKMSRGEVVALTVILKICEYLDCPIQEVVEFIEDKSKSEQA
ncbi:helix-turn-helix domain-containing protein [Bacillus subtilis]|uniref:helix-turn-helix domain-containing protein n=1 Tax=Bacillus subtilis TaxID=1423 RepID=UPI0022E2058A|nr:helix-turn-helix transcriptional regulator [Bacillus subtilis]MDP8527368.1 helix-turn-helix transcriptional regulator [Bacillus subtilis]